MHPNQCLPTIFEPHKDWLLEAIRSAVVPRAWIFKGGCWEMQTSHQSNGLIERFEHALISQQNLGVIWFSGTINSSKEDYTIAYLYNGIHFSHTIFQPRNTTETGAHSENWWIEDWSIDHMLSR